MDALEEGLRNSILCSSAVFSHEKDPVPLQQAKSTHSYVVQVFQSMVVTEVVAKPEKRTGARRIADT